jgi:uncharacterized protein (DUF302 family)
MSVKLASRPVGTRLIIMAAVLALAGLLATAGRAGSARAATVRTEHAAAVTGTGSAKPTIVLLHGAWADSGSWNAVIGLLQRAGYTVYAPPNPLEGLAIDTATLADFLHTITGPIVLVGHSYGGEVITKPSSKSVAQTIDGLRRLMADRGFTVFNVIDHSGVAGRAGVQMPDSKLVMFGKPAVGAGVMLAVPLAALDIPLKVLVWEDRNGAVSVSYNSPGFLAGRHHLEGALRAPFDAVESIVEALPGA